MRRCVWTKLVVHPFFLHHQIRSCSSSSRKVFVASSSTFPTKHSKEPLFDVCFVLNLDRRPDRWQHVRTQLKRSRLSSFVAGGNSNIIRISGVDGNGLDVTELQRTGVLTELGAKRFALPTTQKLFGMDLTPGALGCALGHRRVWERVVDGNYQRALVLEDDVEFAPGVAREIRGRLAVVPADYDLLYLGGLDLLSDNKPPRPFLADGVRRAYEGHRELTAYVLHAKAAAKCLQMSLPLTWQIDTHITNELEEDPQAQSKYIANPLSYVLQPALAIQVTALGTDVQIRPSDNPDLEDASRRMREFVGGGTSKR